jgi:hypothetical protein
MEGGQESLEVVFVHVRNSTSEAHSRRASASGARTRPTSPQRMSKVTT